MSVNLNKSNEMGISRVDPPREQGLLRSKHIWREALAAGDLAWVYFWVCFSHFKVVLFQP